MAATHRSRTENLSEFPPLLWIPADGIVALSRQRLQETFLLLKTWKHGSHPERSLQGCSIQAGAVKQLVGGAGETHLNCWFKFMEGADIWALGGDSSIFNENDMNMSAGNWVLKVTVCRIPPLGIWSLSRFGFRRHFGDIFT